MVESYCTLCGTLASEGEKSCPKCGSSFSAISDLEQGALLEGDRGSRIERTSRGGVPAREGLLSGLTSEASHTMRIFLFGLVVFTVMLVPAAYYMNKAASEVKPPISGSAPGLTPSQSITQSTSPAAKTAGDLQRRARAREIQTGLEIMLAERGSYAASLSELEGEGYIDFKPDPEVFDYRTLEQSYAYELRVEMVDSYVSGDGIENVAGRSTLLFTGGPDS